MYWTDQGSKTIGWAEMDGFGTAVLVSASNLSSGITIDFDTSSLYWTESNKIQSSNLRGTEIRTILSVSGYPHQVVTMQDRVYWTVSDSHKLQSATKAGENVRTLHDGVHQWCQTGAPGAKSGPR